MVERNEDAPFVGNYTGRKDIGKSTCSHVYRRFRNQPINPNRCFRFTTTSKSKFCEFHNTKAKRRESN